MRDDLTPVTSWRLPGDLWNDTTVSDFTDLGGGVLVANTGVVPQATNLQVRVAYLTGRNALSPYSTTFSPVDSTNVAPDPPTSFTRSGSSGAITATWRNPSSANLAGVRVYRGATGAAFATATAIGSLYMTGLAAPDSRTITGQSPGTYDLWLAAENGSGLKSSPVGPLSVTVT